MHKNIGVLTPANGKFDMQEMPKASEVKYQGLFETPLITAKVSNADTLLKQLRDCINAKRQQSPSSSRSNIGGWQSDTQMLQWGGESARALGLQILSILGEFSIDVGQTHPDKPRFEWSAEMWANVCPAGVGHEPHTHPGAMWSAVCFVSNGISYNETIEKAGKLVLQDPRHPTPVMYRPDMRFVTDNKEHYVPDIRISPEPGKIVIFPSWLSHYVTPHRGSGERISIAINYLTLPART